MKNLIFLAIAMTEMDTGIELSAEERKQMADRIFLKVKGFDVSEN